MSVKKYSRTAFDDVTAYKRFDGTGWNTLTIGKRFDDTGWQDILPHAQSQQASVITKTYPLISSASYWGSGSKDSQYPDCIIQGSYNNTLATTRRGMMIFNNAQIKRDIGDGEIKSVRLRLKRANTSHGIGGKASVFIKLHKYTSLPTSWKGDDLGNADSSTPTLSRGETIWVTLNSSALQKLLKGEAGGFALDADTNYSLSGYIRFEKSSVLLEVTYQK